MMFRGLFRAVRLAKQLSPVVCTRTVTPTVSKAIQARCFSSSMEESDYELVSALDGEIKYEREELQRGTTASMAGYNAQVNGSQVYLTKSHGDEIIKIGLNVNEMMEQTPEEDDPEEKLPVYLPHFTISIEKKGHGELVFVCLFENADSEGHGEYEYQVNLVKFVKSGADPEKAYFMDFGNLDPAVIGQFDGYLDRRGLGEGFSQRLLEFSNAFEGDNYLQFLENVRDFI